VLRWGLQVGKGVRVFAARGFYILSIISLCGCGVVGPSSIKLGRNTYNDVIHQTSGDQLLINLARIHNHEMPLFMDVTEVDATVQIQANASAGQTGIGSHPGTTGGTLAGPVENVSLTGQYLEAPTIRYQPLQGAPLIAQFNSPITVDSLVYMFNSDWAFDTLLPLTVDRLTTGFSDYYAALNAIIALDHNGALIIEASQASQPSGGAAPQDKKAAATPAGPNNTLTLYFAPKGLANDNFECETELKYSKINIDRVSLNIWLRLLKIYRPGDIPALAANIETASSSDLQRIAVSLPNSIELPTASIRGKSRNRSAPLLRVRSALGVLKNLVEGEYSLTAFVSPEQATAIMNEPPKPGCRRPAHYYLVRDASLTDSIDINAKQGITSSFKRDADTRMEGVLYNSRKYMLVQVSDAPIVGSYVSAFENGKWYSISNDDEVSKRTLALLALITSVQAIPAQSGGLTPALSIGSR
jgi:hypothetical protein